MRRIWGRATTTAAALLTMAFATVATACAPPTAVPPAPIPQDPPLGVNGMVQDGPDVWVADLFGKQLVRFDPGTGAIAERYRMDPDVCATDDVVVVPGGDLVATCPTEGRVVRVARGTGATTVVATPGRGVNPIALEPSGTSVVVGFGTEDDDRLVRIPLDGGPSQVVASGLPVLNGFGFGPDGLLYVPTGGAGGILGTGGLGRIDVATGAFTNVALSFPDEPGRTGFDFACGADVAPDGMVYVAQCFNAAAYAVDAATGVARSLGRSPLDIADNIVHLSDGRVLLSGFFGGRITAYTPSGGGVTASVLAIGS